MNTPKSVTHRPRTLVALVLLVTALHVWLTHEVSALMPNMDQTESSITRMQAAYVTELKVSAPPHAPAPPGAPPAHASAKHRARRPVPAASAPPDSGQELAEAASAASAPESVPDGAPDTVVVVPDIPPSAVEQAPSAAPVAAASEAEGTDDSADQKAFVWPEATRVSYKVEGNYRGPVYGQASVEWVRKASRYQVHVDASIGPSFAPLGSWRLTSEGHITPEGLSPERYENVNRLLIKTSAPKFILFEEHEVILANGTRVPRVTGVQDPASQFIQLAYNFILKPDLLKVGNSFKLPLAILTRAETLAYDVVDQEVLHTPIGDVPTFHVRPRRLLEGNNSNLPADIWFAPGLQYLPVRIYVKINEETFIDMQMDRAPQQAPGAAAGTPSAASRP